MEVDGDPVGFRDPELWPELGVSDAKSAVVELIGADGDILAVVRNDDRGRVRRGRDEDPI